MAGNNVMKDAFQLALSAPGMGTIVKVPMSISAKNLLLMNLLIESGVNGDGEATKMLANFPESSKEELKAIADDLLEKGQLHEMKTHLEKFLG